MINNFLSSLCYVSIRINSSICAHAAKDGTCICAGLYFVHACSDVHFRTKLTISQPRPLAKSAFNFKHMHTRVQPRPPKAKKLKMADEIGSMAGRVAGKAALKAFINPSLDIIKVIPQGIIELVLRGAAVVSACL